MAHDSHRGATAAYVAGRERVLGNRTTVPLTDPSAAVEAIAAALGGRQLAGAFIRQMWAEVGPHRWPVDDRGDRFDHDALYEGVTS